MVVQSQSQQRGKLLSRSHAQVQQRLHGQLPPQPRDSTYPDGAGVTTWLGNGAIVQLREWGTDKVHQLPSPEVAESIIGAGRLASLRLTDPTGCVSRNHARLVHDGTRWCIEDLRSKNGIRQDNGHCRQFSLVPGVEIGIGGVTLVAENEALIHLRAYLARVLGWDAASRPAIDRAIRALRAAAHQRAPLVIAGTDDLVAVARQIHRRTQGPEAPFVVCGPRPRERDVSVRVTATHPAPTTAFELAAGGTVCVRAEELRVGFDRLMEASYAPRVRTQLIICANQTSKRRNVIAPSIVVPALALRAASDVQRIVFEYEVDGIHELRAAPGSFTELNRKWVTSHAASSFAEIEITTLRLIARNDAGNVHRAAARLGMSHVALGKWLRNRGLLP